MADNLQIIKSRRSVRAYKPDAVPKELVQKILECAVLAPSAMGKNPWKFYVVQNPDLIKAVFAETKKMSYNAPCLIFTTTPADSPLAAYADYDVALAHENICIAAAGLGLGSVILGYNYPTDTRPILKKLLKVPDNEAVHPVGVAIGFPTNLPATPNRKIDAVFL